MKKRFIPFVLALLLLVTAGCSAPAPGSGNKTANSGRAEQTGMPAATGDDYTMYDREDSAPEKGGESSLTVAPTNPNQKIIYYVTYEMETTGFSASTDRLKALTAELQGYIEGSEITSGEQYGIIRRTGRYVLRIPTERLNEFFAAVGEVGNIVQEKLESSDVTLEFVDTTAKMNALKTQETRILEILQQATDLQYVLEIERELTKIRADIEMMTSRLNKLSSLVDYSTVTVSLREVVSLSDIQPAPKTFGQRLAAEFNQSIRRIGSALQDAGIWLFGNIVEIVLWIGLLALGVWALSAAVRRGKKRAKEKADLRYQAVLDNENSKHLKGE